MKRAGGLILICVLMAAHSAWLGGQASSAAERVAPMVLTGIIPLPNVSGRIDHFGLDAIHNRLIVSAYGNNTVEVIDIGAQRALQSISGIQAPQGVVYSPEANKLFVGSDAGKLNVYDGSNYSLLASIDFGDDVDNLRYDAAEKRVYVGYGDEKSGAIAMVDAVTNQRMESEYKLGAHPESFQLAHSTSYLYVNLPDLKQIAVIDRATQHITRWPMQTEGNFPMALDEANHRLFVVTRLPAQMSVVDTNSGKVVAALPTVQDSDDVYFAAARRRIYVSGGEGFICVYQQENADQYRLLAKIKTEVGARTAGYFGRGKKGFARFYVAVPARANRGAEIWVYTLQN